MAGRVPGILTPTLSTKGVMQAVNHFHRSYTTVKSEGDILAGVNRSTRLRPVLSDGFQPVANVELSTDVLHKVSHRSHLDVHFVSDLLVNESRAQQVERLLLTRGEICLLFS